MTHHHHTHPDLNPNGSLVGIQVKYLAAKVGVLAFGQVLRRARQVAISPAIGRLINVQTPWWEVLVGHRGAAEVAMARRVLHHQARDTRVLGLVEHKEGSVSTY